MRALRIIVSGLWLASLFASAQAPVQAPSPPAASPAPAQEQAPTTTAPTASNDRAVPLPCNARDAKACGVSKADLRQARAAYHRAEQLKKSAPEQALDALDEAVRLVPRAVEYVTAREMLRQQLVYDYTQRGNGLVRQKRTMEALAEFQKAQALDPSNEFVAERLREIATAPLPPRSSFIVAAGEAEEQLLQLKPVHPDLHINDDVRQAFNTVGAAFGITMDVDSSVRSQRVRLEMPQADFAQAMNTLAALTHTFWMPASSTSVTVAADTPSAHKQLDRWVLRTFYLPEVKTPQELNDIVNLMRTLFEIRFITQQPASSTITVRAPAPTVEALTQLLQSLPRGRPQVMIDFEAYEVSSTLTRAVGVDLPLQFSIFNIPQSALAALGGQNTQDLINQLIASGGINQANSTAISALLAQLQNQQQNSIFKNPVATFGGGITLMGVGIPPATANLSRNESYVTNLEHVTMRASQGDAATFRLGTRYPILNASFAPVFNTPQISNVIGNSGYIAPFPSFSYEDLGVTLKAKPSIHAKDVTLDLDMEIRSLGAQSFNGVPVISQRAYKGVITVKNDEPAVVAGSISESESKNLSGVPGLGRVPLLNRATSNTTNQRDRSELLVIITPHILSSAPAEPGPTIRIPTGEQ